MMSLLRGAASPPSIARRPPGETDDRRSWATHRWLGGSRSARRAVLGARRGAHRGTPRAALDFLSPTPAATSRGAPETSVLDPRRLRTLQGVGMLCGITAGAWLGAAEAPTKLVTLGLSPVVISLSMVIGVFLARWTLPALIQGTSYVAADLRQAPHLIVWAVLAGCLWAVANTLTIFAVRDVGLSIAFPLWNSNSLLGIFWGIVFFQELRGADWRRWVGVLGGAALMFAGATALAIASATQAPSRDALRGVAAALSAGVLWGTMYIPYRK